MRGRRRKRQRGARRSTEADRALEFARGHVVDLRRAVEDLVHRQDREVERHELDDRAQPEHRCTYAETGKAELRDRRIDDALLTETIEQALRDLVRAVVEPDFLTHQEDVGIALHFLSERLVQRLAICQYSHDPLSTR